MARNAIVAAVVIILLIVAAGWLLLPQIQATGAQIVAGKVAIPVAVLVALWQLIKSVLPERAKLIVAYLIRKLGYLPLGLKRLVVRNEVEGNLNRAVKEFGTEGSRLLPHPASLIWVTPSDLSPESFFREGKIIIKLDYSDNPHRNIVESALLYCRAGLVPETRRYLWSEFRHALDLVFVYAVLERNDLREGLLYFEQDVIGRELESNPDIEYNYNALHGLHDRGYLTRILLPELRDYAGRVHGTDTRAQHKQWIANFVNFLEEVAEELPSGAKRVLDHVTKRIRVSIIIVGHPWKLAFEGQRPYLKRIAKCASQGARTVFVVGISGAIPSISKNAKALGIADSSECQTYYRSFRRRIQQAWCARLEISEQTAASALDRIPGIEDWPELESIIETEEAPSKAAGN